MYKDKPLIGFARKRLRTTNVKVVCNVPKPIAEDIVSMVERNIMGNLRKIGEVTCNLTSKKITPVEVAGIEDIEKGHKLPKHERINERNKL